MEDIDGRVLDWLGGCRVAFFDGDVFGEGEGIVGCGAIGAVHTVAVGVVTADSIAIDAVRMRGRAVHGEGRAIVRVCEIGICMGRAIGVGEAVRGLAGEDGRIAIGHGR